MATLKLVRIGNSKGIRLPQKLIQRHGFGDEVLLQETKNGLLLRSTHKNKLSLDASFVAMARNRHAKSEARMWAESGLREGLENETW